MSESPVILDTRGIPSHECLNCQGTVFRLLASFEDYQISWYTLQGYCDACGAAVSVPCPLDAPNGGD